MHWVAEIRGGITAGNVVKDFSIMLVFMIIAWNGGTYLYELHHTQFERALSIFLLVVGVVFYIQLLQNRAHRIRLDYLDKELQINRDAQPKDETFFEARKRLRSNVH